MRYFTFRVTYFLYFKHVRMNQSFLSLCWYEPVFLQINPMNGILTHIRCVNQALRFIIHPHHELYSLWRVLRYFSLSSPFRTVLSPDIFLSSSSARVWSTSPNVSRLAQSTGSSHRISLRSLWFALLPGSSKCLGNTWTYVCSRDSCWTIDLFGTDQLSSTLDPRLILRIQSITI